MYVSLTRSHVASSLCSRRYGLEIKYSKKPSTCWRYFTTQWLDADKGVFCPLDYWLPSRVASLLDRMHKCRATAFKGLIIGVWIKLQKPYVISRIKRSACAAIPTNDAKSKQVTSMSCLSPHERNHRWSFSGDEFCRTSRIDLEQSPLAFNGGLTGADEGLFFYYMLSLYWPPSSCPPIYNDTTDFRRFFCSPYTDRGQPGSERLVLHGLWPTFATDGDYQGWSQFCTANRTDWSKCHVDGNLCPWANATKSDFTQDDYEYCLAVEGIEPCVVNGSAVLLPEQERLKILAPGYLNHRNLFINHEWTKHG